MGQPYPDRTARRPARSRRPVEPADRLSLVHEPGDSEDPPVPHLPQARSDQPRRAGRRGHPSPTRLPRRLSPRASTRPPRVGQLAEAGRNREPWPPMTAACRKAEPATKRPVEGGPAEAPAGRRRDNLRAVGAANHQQAPCKYSAIGSAYQSSAVGSPVTLGNLCRRGGGVPDAVPLRGRAGSLPFVLAAVDRQAR